MNQTTKTIKLEDIPAQGECEANFQIFWKCPECKAEDSYTHHEHLTEGYNNPCPQCKTWETHEITKVTYLDMEVIA